MDSLLPKYLAGPAAACVNDQRKPLRLPRPRNSGIRQSAVGASAAKDPAAAYKDAAKQVLAASPAGGVVFFPAGDYTFPGDLDLVDRVILRAW